MVSSNMGCINLDKDFSVILMQNICSTFPDDTGV